MTFYDKSTYPNLSILEDNYQTILDEYVKVSPRKLRTWPEKHKFQGSWKVIGFVHDSRRLETICETCPETVKLFDSMGKVTMAGFSRMAPLTDILPHVDDVEEGLFRVHFGIKIPKGDCGFWVDGEKKKWENGKAFVFDPLKIHRAWNKTSEERIVLLIDFKSFC